MIEKHAFKGIENIEKSQPKPEKAANSSATLDFLSPQFFFDENRFTYTCRMASEVVALHFDSKRNEIFYKGHNIRNLNLSDEQQMLLENCEKALVKLGQRLWAEKFRLCLLKSNC